MADSWILVEDNDAPSTTVDPRGAHGYSGFSLRRGGRSDEDAAEVEAASKRRAERDGERYRPLKWRIPLYLGDIIRIGVTFQGPLVQRDSGLCLKAEGRFRSYKNKDGKRVRAWKQFREPVYQELRDPRCRKRVRLAPIPKKVAA